jgi:hypothetical protein
LTLTKSLLNPLKAFVKANADACKNLLLGDLDRFGMALLAQPVQLRLGKTDQLRDEIGRPFDVDVLIGSAGSDAAVQVVTFAVVVLE